MNKKFLESLKELKSSFDTAFVCFFNTGEVRTDEIFCAERIKDAKNPNEFKTIQDTMYRATRSYARECDFDSINMNLDLGLIFSPSDVDEKNNLKEGATPMEGVVRYYTGETTSYLDGERTNGMDYGRYGTTSQGYIGFNHLMTGIKKSGLSYTGPTSFEEFKERILNGEKFKISLFADLKPIEEKENQTPFAK